MHAFVQHAAVPAAPMHAPLAHGVVDDSKLHPAGSAEHAASVDVLAHAGPVPAQMGS